MREIEHKIFIQHSENLVSESSYDDSIIRAVCTALQSEAVDKLCVVNVLITDDKGIREYNREYRDVDKTTDVLSFPMQTFLNSGWDGLREPEFDEDTGEIPLGDIVISLESVKKQAVEYGNSIEYETAYLIIHSALHLLGYDHDNEINEKAMHNKNKTIIETMGLKPRHSEGV